ncbi:MAG: 5-formyltetrahydrofolate cyclo-ligase [Eubacteriales bacterium]
MDVQTQKDRLRAECQRLRGNLTHSDKVRAEAAICNAIVTLPAFDGAHQLLAYYPVRGELSLLSVAGVALEAGKRVAFPACLDDGRMVFRYVTALSQLRRGKYGIPEPPPEAPVFVPHPLTICLVPGLAFDRQGYRVGYGMGYYDRFLADFSGVSMGIVFKNCLFRDVPRSDDDRAVDIVVSETGLLVTPKKRSPRSSEKEKT